MAAIRPERGDRVLARRYQIDKHPQLAGRAGTVVRHGPQRATRFPEVWVEWDGLGAYSMVHPASGLMFQKDGRGRRLRAMLD